MAEIPRILFLNQVTGPLFRELVEDAAVALGACELFTAKQTIPPQASTVPLRIIDAPAYNRRGLWQRGTSWLAYFIRAINQVMHSHPRTWIFIVSNPPFLPLAGWLGRVLLGRRYVLLIYDVYPDLLEAVGKLPRGGWRARIWRAFNRLTWRRADRIFTIGDHMAERARAILGAGGPVIEVIPNWADGEVVRPKAKTDNPFAREHGQIDRLTVMYSGNIGHTHDLRALLGAAVALREDKRVGFLIIGGGARFAELQASVERQALHNVKVLPLQEEAILPLTLTTADVAVVTLAPGVEGCSVPSKTYYALAAGSALLVIAQGENEIIDLVAKHACGMIAAPNDAAAVARAISRFRDDRSFLEACRRNARVAQEKSYSRRNTAHYVAALSKLMSTNQS